MNQKLDPRPWAYSAAAVAIAAALALTIYSWRQTPDQHRNITNLLYNGSVASWHAAEASAHLEAAVAPLADPKTGLAPSMAALLMSVRHGAATLDRTAGNVATLTATLDTQAGNVGASLVPAIDAAHDLLGNYAALPAQLERKFQPSWLAIEPEITCRQIDGTGYGGCWHARVTALLGEAARTGGVFTQQFPILVNTFQQTNTHLAEFTGSFAHITGQVDKKYFPPEHKKTKKEKAAEAARATFLVMLALARGGAF